MSAPLTPAIGQPVATSLLDRASYTPGKVTTCVILQTDRIRQMLFCVPAAGRLPEHRASCDVALAVIEGCGTITLGDELPVTLAHGEHVFMPAGTPHAVAADEDLCLLATFAEPDPEIRFSTPADPR